MTLKELAGQINGATTSSVRNWEANRQRVSLRFRRFVDEFIGVCPYDPSLPIGKRLKERREHLGLSIKTLARALDVDPSALAAWERGEHKPGKKGREKILDFLKSGKTV